MELREICRLATDSTVVASCSEKPEGSCESDDISVHINGLEVLVKLRSIFLYMDRLCSLVVRVLGYRSGGRVRFPALPEEKK
jgi:hypothetical protein